MTAEISTDLARAAALLRAGQLVAFATETVYGLGTDALNVTAVARVFEAKQRPHFDPLIVHLAETRDVHNVVREFPPQAQELAQAFWPGPLTLVLPKRPHVPDLVTSGLPNVAVRVPGHEQARELIRLAGCPVAAPSANLFGRVSPTTADHVAEQLKDRIELILDGGPCRVGIESTVLDLSGSQPVLLRPGGVTLEELQQRIGPVYTQPAQIAESGDQSTSSAAAPGMLPQHYAPRTPVRLVCDWERLPRHASAAALGFRHVHQPERFLASEVLSPGGDLREAAASFFAALRRLDRVCAEVILAERFPSEGLGVALNDRLSRAAASTT
ncbi:MAG: L-threonylcarbamoyladenylate synthase [Planctomycetaceae bacterium]